MNKLPIVRSKDIIVQELGKEILIYDLNTHKAFNLNETSSIVYQACDGKTTFEELKLRTKFTDEIVFLALDELKKENLLKANQSYNSPFSGMSRREVIRKVGFASMIALPLVSSLVAPTAVMAQSGTSQSAACTVRFEGSQGTCPAGQRCVSSDCVACTPAGDPIPGGGTCSFGSLASIRQCCNGSCNAATNQCA